MAYAHDFTKDEKNYNVGYRQLDNTVTYTRYYDSTATGYDIGNGEYIKVFAVPANFLLTEAYVITETVEGAAETIDLVDDDSATTTIVNDANLNSDNNVATINARKFYASAGYVCILGNADITAAKFWIIVKGQILNTNM